MAVASKGKKSNQEFQAKGPLLSKCVTKCSLQILFVIITHHCILPFCYETCTKLLFKCNVKTFNQAQTLVSTNTKRSLSLVGFIGSWNPVCIRHRTHGTARRAKTVSHCNTTSHWSLGESLIVVRKGQAESNTWCIWGQSSFSSKCC